MSKFRKCFSCEIGHLEDSRHNQPTYILETFCYKVLYMLILCDTHIMFDLNTLNIKRKNKRKKLCIVSFFNPRPPEFKSKLNHSDCCLPCRQGMYVLHQSPKLSQYFFAKLPNVLFKLLKETLRCVPISDHILGKKECVASLSLVFMVRRITFPVDR